MPEIGQHSIFRPYTLLNGKLPGIQNRDVEAMFTQAIGMSEMQCKRNKSIDRLNKFNVDTSINIKESTNQ